MDDPLLDLSLSLPVSLWLSMALCDSHFGSHWLSLPLSGILWPSLAHYCSLISLIQSSIGSQGPCSALNAAATLTHFLLLCEKCSAYLSIAQIAFDHPPAPSNGHSAAHFLILYRNLQKENSHLNMVLHPFSPIPFLPPILALFIFRCSLYQLSPLCWHQFGSSSV